MSKTAPTSARGWLATYLRQPVFLEKYPYYAAVLALLDVVLDPSVKQMAVSYDRGHFYLHVNAMYFTQHPEFTIGILLHEVHHVVLGHLTHPKFQEVADRDAMEMAMEMSANEYVEEPLPDPITYKQYERYGMSAGMSTMERYEVLAALRRGHRGALDVGKQTVDDHGPWAKVPTQAGGVEATRGLIAQAVERVKSEQGEREGEGPKKRERMAGRDPGRLMEALTGTLRDPHAPMDWKTALAMFVVLARAPIHTYARPNRRFPHRVGEVPGRTYSPRVITRPHLLVAIDTSSSMEREELAEVARQLTRVAEHARITIVECDTEIVREYPFDGRVDDVAGRGGTDLRPVFDRAYLASRHVDGVVYFTDGQGPLPDEAPNVRVLWVLTKREGFACPWGARVEMPVARSTEPKSPKRPEKKSSRARSDA